MVLDHIAVATSTREVRVYAYVVCSSKAFQKLKMTWYSISMVVHLEGIRGVTEISKYWWSYSWESQRNQSSKIKKKARNILRFIAHVHNNTS